MTKWLVLYVKGARVASVELTDASLTDLAALKEQFCMSLLQRDASGTEHWAALSPRRMRAA